jgi:alpha-1,2-mannosyltransferase
MSGLRFVADTKPQIRSWAWLGGPWGLIVSTLSALFALVNAIGWTIGRRQVDFEVYVMGAHHLTLSSLYTTGLPTWPFLPFTYPPFSAVLFWPLAHAPLLAAEWIWATVNVGLLAVILSVTLRSLRVTHEQHTPWRLVGLLMGPAVLLEPVMLNLSFGQVNLVLVALVLTDMTGRVEIGTRTLPRGILVGIAAAIKLIPLVFVPFLIVTKQWRGAVTAVVTFGLCSLYPFVLNAHTSWRFWTFYISDVKRIGGAAYVSNQSLRGTVDRLTHHLWNNSAMDAGQALCVLLCFSIGWALWRRGATFVAVLVVADAGMLGSPITWCHHMIYVIPVVAWLWWGGEIRGGRWWAVAVATLFCVAPMWRIPNGGKKDLAEHGWHLLAGSSFFFAALFFALAMAVHVLRQRHRA